jgi:hypothetical protein
MANPSRGEVEVTLGDTTHILRPSFTLLREIEGTLGTSIFDIGRKLALGTISATEMATILWLAIRRDPDHKKIKLDEIGDRMFETGLSELLRPMQEFFVKSVDPGKATVRKDDAEGEAKAA